MAVGLKKESDAPPANPPPLESAVAVMALSASTLIVPVVPTLTPIASVSATVPAYAPMKASVRLETVASAWATLTPTPPATDTTRFLAKAVSVEKASTSTLPALTWAPCPT